MDRYQDVRQLPEGRLIKDARGYVWKVMHHPSWNETWLLHFSDEYAVIVKGSTEDAVRSDPGEAPLPFTDLGITEEIERG